MVINDYFPVKKKVFKWNEIPMNVDVYEYFFAVHVSCLVFCFFFFSSISREVWQSKEDAVAGDNSSTGHEDAPLDSVPDPQRKLRVAKTSVC